MSSAEHKTSAAKVPNCLRKKTTTNNQERNQPNGGFPKKGWVGGTLFVIGPWWGSVLALGFGTCSPLSCEVGTCRL